MTLEADNVRVAVTGAVYSAPAATTLPESSADELDDAFLDLGYVSEDGIVQSIGEDRTPIKAWQNNDTVRQVKTSHDVSYALTLLETNDATLEAYYGNTGGGVVEVRADNDVRGEWVIDVVDGDERIRIVIPDGEVVERGDVTYASTDAIAYPITISCYPDDDGVKAYIYVGAAAS